MTIKRKTTMFQGGRLNGFQGYGLSRAVYTEVGEQPVKIIRAIPDGAGEDEEDRYEVEFYNLGRTIVDGCDLHPHPEARQTNVEFLTDLMEFGSTAMVQMFILDGAAKFAEAVSKSDPEECGNAFIHGPAWHATAKEVGAAITAHLKG